METSPLTQQSRPEAFQPKIVQLYKHLFQNEEYDVPTEGFWSEFFLLPVDKAQLAQILATLTADDLLHLQVQTQQLFSRAIREANSGQSPRNSNAFETLTAFLGGVLTKKYTNPSSDVIDVLAGLDRVDAVVSEFVNAVDLAVRNGSDLAIRQRAVDAAISLTAGAYHTGLVSYFTHRDLFPALMKFVNDNDTPEHDFQPLLLLGLLANYNKFEFQNPYQLRLDDFVNEATIQKLVKSIGITSAKVRNSYVEVQDDLPEGWSLNSTLIFLGLRILTAEAKSKKAPRTEEEAKELFNALPPPEATVSLPVYDFTNANKLFGYTFISLRSEKKHVETAFAAFLSCISYLLQHAYRSQRATYYAKLNLFTIQIIVEDQVLCKKLCDAEEKTTVRLCRQRPPYLPHVNGDRVLATIILDMMIDAMSHNLRRRLDADLYNLCIGILLRIMSYLSRAKIRLAYHWSELWRALLSLLRFLTTYSSDLSTVFNIHPLLDSLSNLVAFCLSAGDSFLPDPSSYDDLFYKVIETGTILTSFRDAYGLKSASNGNDHSIDILISVSTHYHELLGQQKGKGKRQVGTREVHNVIKQGYETLSIQAREDLDHADRWKESERKAELKRIARCVVEDARQLVLDS